MNTHTTKLAARQVSSTQLLMLMPGERLAILRENTEEDVSELLRELVNTDAAAPWPEKPLPWWRTPWHLVMSAVPAEMEDRRECARNALWLTGMTDYAHHLMRHLPPRLHERTRIACMLASGVRVILLSAMPDEASASAFKAAGMAIVYQTCSRKQAEQADRMVVLRNGQLTDMSMVEKAQLAALPDNRLRVRVAARGKTGKLALDMHGLTIPAVAAVPPPLGADGWLWVDAGSIVVTHRMTGMFHLLAEVTQVHPDGMLTLRLMDDQCLCAASSEETFTVGEHACIRWTTNAARWEQEDERC